MSNIKTRLAKLEEQRAPDVDVPDVAAFCESVIQAVADGRIADWDSPNFLSPTEASGLTPDEQSDIFHMLQEAQALVKIYAEHTGWRSGGRDDWKGFRANSAAELAAIMQQICEAM